MWVRSFPNWLWIETFDVVLYWYTYWQVIDLRGVILQKSWGGSAKSCPVTMATHWIPLPQGLAPSGRNSTETNRRLP